MLVNVGGLLVDSSPEGMYLKVVIPVPVTVTDSIFKLPCVLFRGRVRKRIAICVVHIAGIRIRFQPVRASQARPQAQSEVTDAERPRPGIRQAVQPVQLV